MKYSDFYSKYRKAVLIYIKYSSLLFIFVVTFAMIQEVYIYYVNGAFRTSLSIRLFFMLFMLAAYCGYRLVDRRLKYLNENDEL